MCVFQFTMFLFSAIISIFLLIKAVVTSTDFLHTPSLPLASSWSFKDMRFTQKFHVFDQLREFVSHGSFSYFVLFYTRSCSMLFFLEDKKLTRFAFLVPLSTEPICLFFCLFSVPLKKKKNIILVIYILYSDVVI